MRDKRVFVLKIRLLYEGSAASEKGWWFADLGIGLLSRCCASVAIASSYYEFRSGIQDASITSYIVFGKRKIA